MTFKEWLLDNYLYDDYDDMEFTASILIGDDDLDIDEEVLEDYWGMYESYCREENIGAVNDLDEFDEP